MEDFNTNETTTSTDTFGSALAKEATVAVVVTAAVVAGYVGALYVAGLAIERNESRREKKAAKKARKNK